MSTTREVDHIVQDLKGMRSNDDFSQVGNQIRELRQNDPSHFQRNMAQINESVDMRALGFPHDFKLAGVNENNRLVTVSEDGRRVEQRNMHNMRVESSVPNTAVPQQWGNREVNTNPVDNSHVYTAKPGDNLWSIARDTLSHQTPGQRPSNNDIDAAVKSIAHENNITDANKLQPHQELRIPQNLRPEQSPEQRPGQRPGQENRPDPTRPEGPYKPNLSANNPEVQPRNGVSSPIAVPGLAADGVTDPAVASRQKGLTERLENGSTVTNYTGKLNDGWITDTKFTAQQTVDAQGRLVHNSINYNGEGASLKINTPTGEQTIDKVSSVETNFNARTGRYDTTFSTSDGARYAAVTGRDGRVVSYRQSAAPGEELEYRRPH